MCGPEARATQIRFEDSTAKPSNYDAQPRKGGPAAQPEGHVAELLGVFNATWPTGRMPVKLNTASVRSTVLPSM